MDALGLIDWILTTALVVASWQLYQVMQPTPTANPKNARASAGPSEPVKATVGPASLEEILQRIRQTGSFRDLDSFIEGAKAAYEAVVTAFAAGDVAPIASWLDPAVLKALEEAIADRVARGETLTTTFIGFLSAEPVDAGIDGGSAWVDMRFAAQMVSVTTDREGNVVAGHPRRVDEVTEVWTFSRETRSADPNWTLVATRKDE